MSSSSEKYVARFLSFSVVGSLALFACTTRTLDYSTLPTRGGDAGVEEEEAKTIKLLGRSWLTADLNNEIARQLLVEKLGISTEVVRFEDFGTDDILAPLSSGEAHANLEVWPDATVDDDLAAGKAEPGGPLGAVGKIGWYVPTYVLQQYPQFATWEGLKGPEAAAAFATPETGTKGRFLAGDKDWGTYDEQITKNLGLNLTVVYAGDEDKLLEEVEAAYQRNRPILFYLWLPHWAFTKYELTPVALPPYSDTCYATYEAGGIDCDYEPSHLYKAFWPGLKEYSPRAYELLKGLRFSTKEQIDLLGRVKVKGETVEQAARFWIDNNEAVWREWMPKE